jgi:hypothetical protein
MGTTVSVPLAAIVVPSALACVFADALIVSAALLARHIWRLRRAQARTQEVLRCVQFGPPPPGWSRTGSRPGEGPGLELPRFPATGQPASFPPSVSVTQRSDSYRDGSDGRAVLSGLALLPVAAPTRSFDPWAAFFPPPAQAVEQAAVPVSAPFTAALSAVGGDEADGNVHGRGLSAEGEALLRMWRQVGDGGRSAGAAPGSGDPSAQQSPAADDGALLLPDRTQQRPGDGPDETRLLVVVTPHGGRSVAAAAWQPPGEGT